MSSRKKSQRKDDNRWAVKELGLISFTGSQKERRAEEVFNQRVFWRWTDINSTVSLLHVRLYINPASCLCTQPQFEPVSEESSDFLRDGFKLLTVCRPCKGPPGPTCALTWICSLYGPLPATVCCQSCGIRAETHNLTFTVISQRTVQPGRCERALQLVPGDISITEDGLLCRSLTPEFII